MEDEIITAIHGRGGNLKTHFATYTSHINYSREPPPNALNGLYLSITISSTLLAIEYARKDENKIIMNESLSHSFARLFHIKNCLLFSSFSVHSAFSTSLCFLFFLLFFFNSKHSHVLCIKSIIMERRKEEKEQRKSFIIAQRNERKIKLKMVHMSL